ncbi:hypothetical protein EXM22_09295 [Oceanispirochaeta crateris]|uniref:Lipoprotein n=1 Tax=Oceanispirochaeta crateris TaxID=2518645 RepID=A0A5C1QKP3_9SPIO|nr:hypothetical protein [Oceanispirochaeta crateris]QEN08171.1 hypothetical protein EXM22_09295 [Oceanispirochaeta crateris]
MKDFTTLFLSSLLLFSCATNTALLNPDYNPQKQESIMLGKYSLKTNSKFSIYLEFKNTDLDKVYGVIMEEKDQDSYKAISILPGKYTLTKMTLVDFLNSTFGTERFRDDPPIEFTIEEGQIINIGEISGHISQTGSNINFSILYIGDPDSSVEDYFTANYPFLDDSSMFSLKDD